MDASGNLSGYAWSSYVGWINFHPTHGQVTVFDLLPSVWSGTGFKFKWG